MSRETRLPLIQRIEELRSSKVICYVTSLRVGVPAQMADDQVRVFFEHLQRLPAKPVEKLDVFLVSNGGESLVPWRLVALFREFSSRFEVLIPYKAYSAATLLALGADQIVMHPLGEIGPIDPTVSNEYNPKDPQTGRQMGISVEDVKAYVGFIKNTVGIHHEDELVKTIEILANQVHPLALGNVERFLSQSRMVARKILATHMDQTKEEHRIEEIIENLASKLYFHGHPINRKEASKDLKLDIESNLQPELETAIWDLYKDFEDELQMTDQFNPMIALQAKKWEIIEQFRLRFREVIAAKEAARNAATDAVQMNQLAAEVATLQQQYDVGVLPSSLTVEDDVSLIHACIESEAFASQYETKRRYSMTVAGMPAQVVFSEDVQSQGWIHSQGEAV